MTREQIAQLRADAQQLRNDPYLAATTVALALRLEMIAADAETAAQAREELEARDIPILEDTLRLLWQLDPTRARALRTVIGRMKVYAR
jgi:hypothetical protein